MSDGANRDSGWRAWAREVADEARAYRRATRRTWIALAVVAVDLVGPGVFQAARWPRPLHAPEPEGPSGLVLAAFCVGAALLWLRGRGVVPPGAGGTSHRVGLAGAVLGAWQVTAGLTVGLLGVRVLGDTLLHLAGLPAQPGFAPLPGLTSGLLALGAALPAAAGGAVLGTALGRLPRPAVTHEGADYAGVAVLLVSAVGASGLRRIPPDVSLWLAAVPGLGLAWVPAGTTTPERVLPALAGLALSIALVPWALTATCRLAAPVTVAAEPAVEDPTPTPHASRRPVLERLADESRRLGLRTAAVVLGVGYLAAASAVALAEMAGVSDQEAAGPLLRMTLIGGPLMAVTFTLVTSDSFDPAPSSPGRVVERDGARPSLPIGVYPFAGVIAATVTTAIMAVSALVGVPVSGANLALAPVFAGLATPLALAQAVAFVHGTDHVAGRVGFTPGSRLRRWPALALVVLTLRIMGDQRLDLPGLSPFVPFVGTTPLFDVTALGPLPWLALAAQAAWAALAGAVLIRVAPPAPLGGDDGGAA